MFSGYHHALRTSTRSLALNINLNIPFGHEQFHELSAKLDTIIERIAEMSQNLDQIKAAVAQNTTVIGSAITLINGFAGKLQAAIDAGANPADLQAMVDELNAEDAALAAAVAANTETAPSEPPAEPVPEETPAA